MAVGRGGNGGTVIYLPVVKSMRLMRVRLSNGDSGPYMERGNRARMDDELTGDIGDWPSSSADSGTRFDVAVTSRVAERTAGHLGPKFPPRALTPSPQRLRPPLCEVRRRRPRASHSTNGPAARKTHGGGGRGGNGTGGRKRPPYVPAPGQ